MIYIAAGYSGSGDILMQAALTTLFMFAGLTAVVFLTSTDFSFLRTMIIVGGFVSLGFHCCGRYLWLQPWTLVFCRNGHFSFGKYIVSDRSD